MDPTNKVLVRCYDICKAVARQRAEAQVAAYLDTKPVMALRLYEAAVAADECASEIAKLMDLTRQRSLDIGEPVRPPQNNSDCEAALAMIKKIGLDYPDGLDMCGVIREMCNDIIEGQKR